MVGVFFRTISFLSLLLLIAGCGCESGARNGFLRIGVDSNWYPLDFENQEPYVNGFTEDLLLEMARYSGMKFEKIPANWDTLLEGVTSGKYDAVFSSLPPYPFNRAKYDFSEVFLDLGPVLVVAAHSPFTELSEMEGKLVGVVAGDPAVLVLQAYPEIIVRNYASAPELFNAIVQGEIEGALYNQIPAFNYVNDLYADQLKIASPPLTDAGLRLIAPKGKQEHLIYTFDTSLKHFKKKKKFEELLKKWQLGN